MGSGGTPETCCWSRARQLVWTENKNYNRKKHIKYTYIREFLMFKDKTHVHCRDPAPGAAAEDSRLPPPAPSPRSRPSACLSGGEAA